MIGVGAKLSLWHTLELMADDRPAAAALPLERLIERAESQLEGLRRAKVRATELAFGARGSSAAA